VPDDLAPLADAVVVDPSTRAEAEQLLHRLAGPDASFRPGQLEAVAALVDERRRVLVVQRTGWGKSAVYFLATRLLRERGAGPTLLVSPLLALMRNQVEAARRVGVEAVTINSDNMDEWDEIERRALAGEVDLLLVSPERLNNPRFRSQVLERLLGTVGLLVVDEVHCISDWGHDFRPDYRRIAHLINALPGDLPVLGCTATANDRVVADVAEQLGEGLLVQRGPLGRESLRLRVVDLPTQAQRLAWLATELPHLEGSGIVYCLTIADTVRVSAWLRHRGIDALSYSGASAGEDRPGIEDALQHNDVKVVVATSALGMGFDKPDLGFVVHFQSPGSAIAYYQQIGRAGRGVERADVVLLRGSEDRRIQDWFIDTAFPSQEQAEAVLEVLAESPDPVSLTTLEAAVNLRRSRLETMLKVLEVEGAVGRDRGRWWRTPEPWAYDAERVERVTAARRTEQQAMDDYATTSACLMRVLLGQLDDPDAGDCGRCGSCAPSPEREVDPAVARDAVEFLRTQPLVVEPRKQWPASLDEPKGKLGPDGLSQEGRALAVLGDAGWGGLVLEQREAGAYGNDLVRAAAELVGSWRPEQAPTWVTCVPSQARPELVPRLAERIAEQLGLPFQPVVEQVRPARPQTEMQNSAQKVGNTWRSFQVVDPVPAGPVLLVDDVVDSRWTLTVVGFRLRQAGVPAVLPLVLAQANG
jgi:ATP-dependent DNA helicase RecQ